MDPTEQPLPASSSSSAGLSMDERLRLMVSNPQRRNRGQVPMDQVELALKFQRGYVAPTNEFNVSAVSDCSDCLVRLRTDKREAREHREMTWEDHIATTIRDDKLRKAAAKAKKLAQETTMLAQLKTDKDKWNMAVELKLTEYLLSTLSVVDVEIRQEFLASRNTSGQTPLHRAVSKSKDAKLVELLLDLDADLVARDDAGRSAFQLATEIGHTEIFRALLTHKKSVDIPCVLVQVNAAGHSLLHTCATYGQSEILQLVLQSLDPIKLLSILNLQTTKDKATALHLAAQHGHEKCLRLLLQTNGIRSDLHNANGSNALHLVLQQTFNIDNLVDAFIQALSGNPSAESGDTFDTMDENSGHNCLHMAIIKSFRAVAIVLIRTNQIGLNASTRAGGWGALHLAVMIEDIQVVKALLESGAMVDTVDNDGQTPLLQACLGGQLDIVRVLLLGGANPTQQNKQGHSPLHYLAAFCRDRELLVDIIQRGGDVNAKSLKLNTPMHFAAMNGNEVATQVLLDHGASTSAMNEDKRTVVYLAKKWRHRAVEDLVKPPEEKQDPQDAAAGRAHGSALGTRSPNFGAPGAPRRAAPFTSNASGGSGGGHGHSHSNLVHEARGRTPMTTRSEDSDADSIYSFDDEVILEPSTPWPVQVTTAPASRGNNKSPSRGRTPQCQSFGELRARFMAVGDGSSPTTTARGRLKPLVLPQHKGRHHSGEPPPETGELVVAAAPQLTRFTRKLLTGPVHIPWEMTVPTLAVATSPSTSDSALQRKLKPSIRTNIGLLRDNLTHAQHLNWPRYANQRVFRKDDQL